MWTVYTDRYSGGSLKTPHEVIAIEAEGLVADEELNRRWPDALAYGETCECCGPDFRIETSETEPTDPGVFKVRAADIGR